MQDQTPHAARPLSAKGNGLDQDRTGQKVSATGESAQETGGLPNDRLIGGQVANQTPFVAGVQQSGPAPAGADLEVANRPEGA
jgi:hypothetical protein